MKDIPLLGSHVPLAGPDYFLGSVKEALSWGETAFMVYTGAPQNTRRIPLDRLKISEGLRLWKASGRDPSAIVVHAPYVINLASGDPEKAAFGVRFLIEEGKRTAALGSPFLVLHPGNAMGLERWEAIDLLAARLGKVLSAVPESVAIVLETMAGKGTELGRTLEEIGEIITACGGSPRLGVTIDTCHLNDAGYDMSDISGFLDLFDETIGLDRLKVVHLNDSKNPRGSRKDRHENLGKGTLGLANLAKIAREGRLKGVPKILETPYVDGKAPYKDEIALLNSLS